jgi:hypothetical protein
VLTKRLLHLTFINISVPPKKRFALSLVSDHKHTTLMQYEKELWLQEGAAYNLLLSGDQPLRGHRLEKEATTTPVHSSTTLPIVGFPYQQRGDLRELFSLQVHEPTTMPKKENEHRSQALPLIKFLLHWEIKPTPGTRTNPAFLLDLDSQCYLYFNSKLLLFSLSTNECYTQK